MNGQRADRLTWALWLAFALVVVVVRYDALPTDGNVFNIYREAGLRWLAAENLYSGGDFLYLPPAAIAFVPFSFLPFALGGALWRCLNLGLFAWGIWSARALAPRGLGHVFFPVVSAITMALCWSAARYGQMTLSMGGLMLLGVVHLYHGNRWRAAAWLVSAVALKPLAIVLILLVAAIHTPLRSRVVGLMVFVFFLPFAFQDFGYVIEQYASVPGMFQVAAERVSSRSFQEIFALLETMGVRVIGEEKLVLRGMAAVGVLVLCMGAKHRLGAREAVLFLFSLATMYILLFGAGTERNTYALMGPVIGWLWVDLYGRGRQREALACLCLGLLTIGSHSLAKNYPGSPFSMIKTLACALLACYWTHECWSRIAIPLPLGNPNTNTVSHTPPHFHSG